MLQSLGDFSWHKGLQSVEMRIFLVVLYRKQAFPPQPPYAACIFLLAPEYSFVSFKRAVQIHCYVTLHRWQMDL